MKSYADWSARGRQLGWSANETSQAAYQGYVNNVRAQQSRPAQPSSPAPAPMQQAPTPSPQPQVQQLQQSVASLQSQIQSQANAYEAQQAKLEAMKPRDASQALSSTILTSPFGDKVKKKSQSFLTPIGG